MGQIVVDVGSFDLTSHNGNTSYSSVKYFDIPANAGITRCVATFATHVNTGNFQGKSFSFNGVQAHPNTPWPTSGIELNPALLATGANTFRAAVKSQAGLSARWSIGTIYLTIDYNDVSGGGGSYIGGVSVNKTYAEITGGDAITVTCPAQGGYWHYVTWEFGSLSGYWSHGWGAGGVMNLTPALNWAEQIPNAASGVLTIRVYIYNTPAPPHNLVSELVFTVTLGVPYWMAPSIAAFDAARIVNNTPSSISDYVQNVSGVSLAVSGISGSYGSSIVSCVISGGGFSLNGTSGNIGRLPNAGNIDFTAEVTDSRGRKAYKSLNINVLAYTPITVSGVTAFRSDASKTPADEGLFATLKATMVISSLNGQNTGTVNGRVYEKGTPPPAWTVMANDTLVLFGGSLSIEKAYTAEIKVSDLISEQKYSIDIPTATVIMGIAADGDGVSFGVYPEAGKLKSAWPIYSEDKRVWKDGDTLTSGGQEVLKNYYLGAPGDHYDIVIPYCATNNEDPSALSISIGTLTAFRINGLVEPFVFSVSMQKSYNSINAAGGSTQVSGGGISVHSRVRFIYNNKLYCGYRYVLSASDLHFYFHGRTYSSWSWFTNPFIINIRNTNTGAILNAEVWNSLVVY